MTQRMRKLVGAVALLVLVIVYSLLAMVLAATVLPQVARWLHPFLYILAGFAWVPFAGLIVTWMHGGRREAVEE